MEEVKGNEQKEILRDTASFPVKVTLTDRVVWLIADSWKKAVAMILDELELDDVFINYLCLEQPSLEELNSVIYEDENDVPIRLSQEMNNKQEDRIVVVYFW